MRLSYYNLRTNLRLKTLFSRSGKLTLARTYLLKWLGRKVGLGRRLGRLLTPLFPLHRIVRAHSLCFHISTRFETSPSAPGCRGTYYRIYTGYYRSF